jgi:TM2 domain-containing membrane protein YozV
MKKSNKKKVNWLAALLLSIFLGSLGVDRFFMGRVLSGVIKLLITILTIGVFGWIWWIIDIILIATKYNFEGIEWVE